MAQIWLMELLKGLGRFFLHPVFYYLVFLSGILGVLRVKQERKHFHIRAMDAWFEMRQLPAGTLIGLLLSIVMVGVGITVPVATIILVTVITFLVSLTGRTRLLAPAYTVGAAFFALIFIADKSFDIPLFSNALSAVDEKVYPSVAILLGILIIGEGLLIVRNATKGTSPKLIKSKRGQRVGVHEVKRLWFLPLFLLVPGDALTPPLDWWPVFNLGNESFSLWFVPFAVGFHQQVQGMLPKEAVALIGKRVMTLGLLAVLVGAGGYWMPVLAIVTVAFAMIGREVITFRQLLAEDSMPFYFSKKNHGLMILGIIPESPASKMGLEVGELVTKVNGIIVREEKELYEALQRNRAHCKLEVLDNNGQVRFVQRALYEGDHYQLGILFVQDEKKWDEVVV
ncbi:MULTISPECIES: PDZ domain-containing protein [unclassified Bacillus (in: firmicutes)]|uniref:PDZ domain-containing protein n=1 Tax=unclassified Bacillus (in: firmicutes) TaxID=185979 RepID=UPI0008F1AFE0|nr:MULTISPECIES: PDZ domain-containing protein [unclassified Bacillus (in: firmicutes)]SFB21743.1 hypothetical protein SAMN02799634_10917 [Bacillus sp. UNCCL13]SFQ91021.1 hypothetical protein SAMN04488577_3997 [Bacillus sp. cl95]